MGRRKGSKDRPILWLIRQPRGLVAATPYDLEALESYRIGSRLTCTLEQPRDEILNRKWHGLVGIVAKAVGKDFRAMKAEILMRAGYIRGVTYFDGSTVFETMSISDLDQADYMALYERTVELITTEIIPGADVADLFEQTYRHIGVDEDDI